MAKITDWDSHIGRRLKLRDLHVFFTVVQHGSLARAAAHLRVSQPAVSQLVIDLENVLGAKLFDRSSRGVTPTIYGNALMTHARAAFDELKQGIRTIDFLSDRNSGEVKFSCPEGLAPLLPPIIESFSADFPGIILDIYEEEFASFATKLRDRKLDFALQRLHGLPKKDDPAFDGLTTDLLFNDEVVVTAGLRSQWAKRRKVALSDLLNEPWILTGPPSWNHSVVAEACHSRGLSLPKIILSTFSTHIRANMVSSGRFIATFPKSVARVYAERFAIKILPVELPKWPWPVAILTLKERSVSPAVELFIEHLRDYTRPMRGSESVPT